MQNPSKYEATSIHTYLRILRRRAWIIVLCAIVAPVVAYYVSHRETPKYAATADVFINQQNLAAALTGINASGLTVGQSQTVDTDATLASVPNVAARALQLADLHDRSPQSLLAQTAITPNSDTNIIAFKVTDSSPTKAQLLATAFARAFTRYRNDLDSQPIVRARREVERTMAELDAEGRKHSGLYENLAEKDAQMQTLQTLQTGGAVVIRTASAGVRISPHPRRNAALGLLLGIVLGVGFAFGAEALDTRIRSTVELGEELGGLPLLARLPPPAKRLQKRDELVMVAQPKHNAAEAFRLLRANLEFVRVTGHDVRTILITSAVEKEGKSTTAANLAISEARSGRSVVLVDLDLRRPYIERFFRLVGAPGITDVVLGSVELDRALHPIELSLGSFASAPSPNARSNGARSSTAADSVLDVLVCGPAPPDPGEFVASERVQAILAQLRESYDTVIIDSPPVLRVGDALTLSSYADGVIVVARLKTLRRSMLDEMRRLLSAVPTQKLGFVVTGPIPGERAAYGDAYSYGYGYTARSSSEDTWSRPAPARGLERGEYGRQGAGEAERTRRHT